MAENGGGTAAKAGAIVNAPGSGRFMESAGLTDQQTAFVRAYVTNGGLGTAAADAAGYSHGRHDAWRLLRNEAVLGAIKAEQARRVLTEGRVIAFGTLLEVAQDRGQTGAARTSAARALLAEAHKVEQAGHASEGDDKPLGAMTLAELEATVARRMAARNVAAAAVSGEEVPGLVPGLPAPDPEA
jgi:hypothetical protein